jgi:fused signal recognition particle receptor
VATAAPAVEDCVLPLEPEPEPEPEPELEPVAVVVDVAAEAELLALDPPFEAEVPVPEVVVAALPVVEPV